MRSVVVTLERPSSRTAHWTVEVFLDRDEWGNMHAEAFLLTSGDEPLFARGVSSAALGDLSAGTEADAEARRAAARLVAARALSELARVLLDSEEQPATTKSE